METKDNMIYTGLLVVVWIIFVGLCINAGGLVVNFIFSLIRPDLLGNLYEKLDNLETKVDLPDRLYNQLDSIEKASSENPLKKIISKK